MQPERKIKYIIPTPKALETFYSKFTFRSSDTDQSANRFASSLLCTYMKQNQLIPFKNTTYATKSLGCTPETNSLQINFLEKENYTTTLKKGKTNVNT